MIRPAWKSPALAFVLLATVVFSAWLTLSLMTSAGNRVAAAGMAQPLGRAGPNEPRYKPVNSEPGDGPQISVNQITGTQIFVNVPKNGKIVVTPTLQTDWYWLASEVGTVYEVKLSESPIGDYQLELTLYDSSGLRIGDPVKTSPSLGEAKKPWKAEGTRYSFKVTATPDTTEDAPYQLIVEGLGSTPEPAAWDSCEINDSLTGTWSATVDPGGPCAISVGALNSDLNFMPHDNAAQQESNPDYFQVRLKAGNRYRIATTVTAGVDTELFLYAPEATDDSQILAADDDSGEGLGSRIDRDIGSTGDYKIKVINSEQGAPVSSETYTLLVQDITPTPTVSTTPGTPTVTSTPIGIPGSPDAFEPNWDFDVASLIGLGIKYTNLNFVPWGGQGVDNDFYKLWVTAGLLYTCETLDLGDATNTNMILYSCPSQECGFAGNDDIVPFDPNDPYRSRITFFSSYTGYLYVLLGQVGADRILPGEWSKLSYSLHCYIDLPGTATPTPTSEYEPPPPQPTPTPQLTSLPSTPIPTSTPLVLLVIPLTTPEPLPPPPLAVTSTPQVYVIEVVVFYDRNGNGRLDPGEGIVDALARAYDAITGDLLSIDYTDEAGFIRFTLPSSRPVRVSVPFFGFDQIVTATSTSIQIRISPLP